MKENLRILKVLMWKHLVVRRRRYFCTLFELCLPILLMAIIFLMKDRILVPLIKSEKALINATTLQKPERSGSEPVMELDSFYGPTKIFYTPDNELTGALMAIVGKKLKLKRLTKFPGPTHRGYLAIANASDLAPYIDALTSYDALVIFNDMANGILPDKLAYTVRMKGNDFHTETYEPQNVDAEKFLGVADEPERRHDIFGTVYETFLRLQWAVDSSYLQIKTGSVIDKKILLREMPYTTRKLTVDVLKQVIAFIALLAVFLGMNVTFVKTVVRTTTERASGVQELLKTSGASTSLIYLSQCLNSLIVGLFFAIIVTIVLTVGEHPFVSSFSPFFLFLMLVLYSLSIIAFALASAGIVTNVNNATTISYIMYTVSYFVAMLINNSLKSEAIKNPFLSFLLGILVPLLPVTRFFSLSVLFDSGLSWTVPYQQYGSLILVYVCLIGQILLYFFIAWYLYNVHPGKYGVALPFNFLFMRDYWRRPKIKPAELMELQEARTVDRDPRYFEPIRADQQIGIKVVNLSKVYKSLGKAPVAALWDVNIDVCKDGITVLLGHNGAGKTTLIDIITGMQSATAGEIYVNGHHFKWDRAAIHKQLGYCPQLNLLFPDLNVVEHFVLFSMIRGNSLKKAYIDARRVIIDLNLKERANAIPRELSGGMSRRVQIGCALVGNTSVLVLDEPTSSLDVQSRRQLWDVLLALRGRCTVLVSTHFLEEADALGARVVALRRGSLTCDAEPLHLKRSIGEGYYLTIGGGNEALAPTIVSVVPSAQIYRMTPTSVTYSLPNSETGNLPKLFTQLETRRTELGILSMGVSAPTLEEVFLKLCYDGNITDSYDQVDRSDFFGTSRKLTGPRLWRQQFVALVKRFLRYMRKNWASSLIYIIIPLAVMVAIIISSNNYASESDKSTTRSYESLNPAREMSFHIYDTLPFLKVMYSFNANSTSFGSLKSDKLEFVRSDNVHEDALRQLEEDERNYERNLMGIEINDTTAQVLYSKAYRHLAPVALNLLTNLMAQHTISNATNASLRTVTTYNYPITTTFDSSENLFLRTTNASRSVVPKKLIESINIAWYLPIFVISVLYYTTTLLKEERKSGARCNYLRAGVSSTLYWCSTLVMNMLMFIVIYLPVFLLPMAIFDANNTVNTKEYLLTLALILIVSAAASLAFQFAILTSCRLAILLWIMIYAFIYLAIIIPWFTFEEVMHDYSGAELTTTIQLLAYTGYIFPFSHIGRAIFRLTYMAHLNAFCRLNRDLCPTLPKGDRGFDPIKCCESNDNDYLPYFSSHYLSPVNQVVILFFMTIFYMIIAVLGQNGVFSRWSAKMAASRYEVRPLPKDDPYVAAEREYVAKQIAKAKQNEETDDDALLMHDIHKLYPRLFRRSVVALEGINLSVRRGECFGILGVNGAGKTTAFKIIVGEEYPTRGENIVNGCSLAAQRSKYLNSVAYCQQYGGVDGFLTGRQCLETLLTVSGYPRELVQSETVAWLECVDMTNYADKWVETYSGGCARRLATAAALCGARPLVLLDEPSSGVDTAARQKLWRAVNRSLGYSAVVLTSHSMDEMEALCARMALVRRGRMCALGDAHALRHAHASGHALLLRLAHGGDEASRVDLVNTLKEDVQSNFDCTLKQEIGNQLDYHINVSMSYSELFTKLAALKVKHSILDEYCVNETTLEEVFLTFAAGKEGERKKEV